MTLITAVLVVRQQQFNSSTLLRSLAYSVALSVRQAQTYGVSTRGTAGNFAAQSYGIYISNASLNSYILFADTDNSGGYNSGDTVVQTFTLGTGYTLTNFAVQEPNNATNYDCMTNSPVVPIPGGNCVAFPLSSLAIMFHRPNPDGCFVVTNSGGNSPHGYCDAAASYTSYYPTAYIQISSSGGSSRSIRVNQTGQIEVESVGT